MAVSFMVTLLILSTSVLLPVDGSYFSQFYPFYKALESALTTEGTLYTMRQAFFPVVHANAQETQQVRIRLSVEITVDWELNSTSNNSCVASELKLINMNKTNGHNNKNVSSFYWEFLWTDSALLSLITIDQLIAFDVFAEAIYSTAIGLRHSGDISATLPLICSAMPNISDIKTSLMLLLSWSKSYARHRGVPPQWEETDKGYIQEFYNSNFLAESMYNENDVHLIRLGIIITFTLLNILVSIGVLSYSKQYYVKICHMTSESTRLTAVTWAFVAMAVFMNFLYLLATLNGFFFLHHSRPKVWECFVSEADWCTSLKSTTLYSDEVVSLFVKLTVVPFTIVVELITAVRLTSHTLLPFPCTMATTSQCCSLMNTKTVQTVLIWNVMVLTQITLGVVLLPVVILIVIAPVAAVSCITTLIAIPSIFIGIIAHFLLRWCNPISPRQCCSISLCVHLFITLVILFLCVVVFLLYYNSISLGVEPWSVKGSILSLLPSFLFTPVLWLAKRYFFKKDRATEEVISYMTR